MTLSINDRCGIIKELSDMVQEYVVDTLVREEHRDLFTNRFHLTIGGKGCWGGIKNGGIPKMQMSTSDRYFDRERAIADLVSRTHLASTSCSVWRKAYQHALNNKWYHVEYASITNDLEIGAFVSDNYEDHVLAATCHEYAHVVNHFNDFHTPGYFNRARLRPHGNRWRVFYRVIRNEFYNPWIDTDRKEEVFAASQRMPL